MRRWYEEHVDVKELIEELRKNVTVRKENYLGIAIYKGNLSLIIHSSHQHISSKGDLFVKLVPKGLMRIEVYVPVVFEDKKVEWIRLGLDASDGGESGGNKKMYMGTVHTWQVILWAAMNPGKLRIGVTSINLNKNSTTITWNIRTERDSMKHLIPQIVENLTDEGLKLYALGGVLGDGWVGFLSSKALSRNIPAIHLTYGSESEKYWRALEKLSKFEV